jgi:ZIP family zinc transporter
MIVLFSSIVDIRLGLIVAIAIAIHNIPEGIAIAMPIYYATGNKIKAFSYAAFSGIAEPIGAIIAYLFLMNFLNVFILNIILAAVAGIMVFISFDELLPNALKYEKHHITIAGVFIGMAVMAVSLAVI